MPRIGHHILLTRYVLSYINYNFPKEFLDGLEAGIKETDIVNDYVVRGGRKRSYRYRVRHHSKNHSGPNVGVIDYYYCLALYYWRNKCLYDSGRALGRALHYLQDGAMDIKESTHRYMELLVEKYIDNLYRGEVLANKIKEVINKHFIFIENFLNEDLEITTLKESTDNPNKAIELMILYTYMLLSRFCSEIKREVSIEREIIKREVNEVLIKKAILSITTILWYLYLVLINPLFFLSIPYSYGDSTNNNFIYTKDI